MSQIKIDMPEKLFGMDARVFLVWLTPVAVGLALLFTFLGVILPKISEINDTVNQVRKVNQNTQAMIDKRKYFESVDQEELNANSSLLSSGVMPQKNAYLLVKVIQQVAQLSGFQVSDFSVSLGDVKQEGQSQKGVDFEKIPVQLVLSGPRSAYLGLIQALERNLPVLSIDSFSMKGNDEVATIELNISAYFQPESISQVKIESLSLKEMTLKNDEVELLARIKEFKAYGGSSVTGTNGEFKSYDRSDPFFTP